MMFVGHSAIPTKSAQSKVIPVSHSSSGVVRLLRAGAHRRVSLLAFYMTRKVFQDGLPTFFLHLLGVRGLSVKNDRDANSGI